MDIESFTTINEVTYRAVLMLIQGITLIVGLASAMFMFIAIVCAACDRLGVRQFAHRQLKSATEARANEPIQVPASIDGALDRSCSEREARGLGHLTGAVK